MSIIGQALRRTINELSRLAEYCSRGLWLRRWNPKRFYNKNEGKGVGKWFLVILHRILKKKGRKRKRKRKKKCGKILYICKLN